MGISKNQVKKAGTTLRGPLNIAQPEVTDALEVLNAWRKSHADVLTKTSETLKSIAQQAKVEILQAQRIKRTESVIAKLGRFSKTSDAMNLANMGDIAGCRVIVENAIDLEKLTFAIKKKYPKHDINDYINAPKKDGYRGVHIYVHAECPTTHQIRKVEIQLRTKEQHAWATAVEIVDLFTSQSIKTNNPKDNWAEFFKDTSTLMEKHEKRLACELHIIDRFIKNYTKLAPEIFFNTLKEGLKITTTEEKNRDQYFLLKIDIKNKTTKINFFDRKDQKHYETYFQMETENLNSKDIVIALISSESINNIKISHENYFATADNFIKITDTLCRMWAPIWEEIMTKNLLRPRTA